MKKLIILIIVLSVVACTSRKPVVLEKPEVNAEAAKADKLSSELAEGKMIFENNCNSCVY
jgi:cytochrome c5